MVDSTENNVKKLAVVAVLLLVTAVLIGYRLGSSGAGGGVDKRFLETVEPIASTVPVATLSPAEASVARQTAYREFVTIGDVLALPTDFARREALYVLAGRSSSSELQDLLFQAVSIDDVYERGSTIRTLLSRLIELDPLSALAIAESPAVSGVGEFTRHTWYYWAKLDFAAALDEASRRRSDSAQLARSLYLAVSAEDTAEQEQIKTALGHGPSRQTVSTWARVLYAESPPRAAGYIEGLESEDQQYSAVQSVAYYVAGVSPEDGGLFASYLLTDDLRRYYQRTLMTQYAALDADRAVQMVFSDKSAQNNIKIIDIAARRLAGVDLDRLDELIEILGGQNRTTAINAASSVLEEGDPILALQWFTAHRQTYQGPFAYNRLISRIAEDNPQRAVEEALKLSRPEQRNSAIAAVAFVMLEEDPIRAFSVLDSISNTGTKKSKTSNLFMAWLGEDEANAMAWYKALPADERAGLFSSLPSMGRQKPEQAVRLMAMLPENEARSLRRSLVFELAQREDFDASMEFLKQFEAEPDYPALKAQVLSTLARSDAERALQIAQQEPDGESKDFVLVAISESLADRDPKRALLLTEQIKSDEEKIAATIAISQAWLRNDPIAAMAWIKAEPPGPGKDEMLSTAVYSVANQGSAKAHEILEQINDPEIRKSAGLRVAQQMYFVGSPEDGVRILEGLDLTEEEVERHKAQAERYRRDAQRRGYYP